MGLEKMIMSFGFTQNSMIIAVICIVVLLGNFTGGLLSNILLAQGKSIKERGLIRDVTQAVTGARSGAGVREGAAAAASRISRAKERGMAPE